MKLASFCNIKRFFSSDNNSLNNSYYTFKGINNSWIKIKME